MTKRRCCASATPTKPTPSGTTEDPGYNAPPSQLVRAHGSLDGFAHRSWTKSAGFSDAVFDGRPVIGIANSFSELTTCNAHLRQVADAVKRGVWSAGGFPLEFPTISLGEVLMKPTAMLFRKPPPWCRSSNRPRRMSPRTRGRIVPLRGSLPGTGDSSCEVSGGPARQRACLDCFRERRRRV